MRLFNKLFILFLMAVAGVIAIKSAYAYGISAVEIYRQANINNVEYFRIIKRYEKAIDFTNASGDSAYCIAIKNKNEKAIKFLERWGADTNHECVKYAKESAENKVVKKEKPRVVNNSSRKVRLSAGGSGSSAWAWGLGAVAVGGAAVAIGGGGGGGSDDGATNPNDGNNGGGNNGGGNNGGGNNGGGNNGGGNNDGGNNGGNDDYIPEKLVNTQASDFETNEYLKTNFLGDINASKAYEKMFYKDEKGKLYSHQADSNEALKEIKVGVLDTGVGNNADLSGKIENGYDINEYNKRGNLLGFYKNGVGIYLYHNKKNNLYYEIIQANGNSFSYSSKKGYKEGELSTLFGDINSNLKIAYGINLGSFSLSDFEILNDGDWYAPGTNIDDDKNFNNDAYALADTISHGSHVSGIITGNKDGEGMHGVAFDNAKIVAVSWDMSKNIDTAVNNLVNVDKVKIISNSWGVATADQYGNKSSGYYDIRDKDKLYTVDQDMVKSYAHAAQNGVVWVQATGNEGTAEPAIHIGMGHKDFNIGKYGYNGPEVVDGVAIEAPFVAVAALDGSTKDASAPSGKIASYSNRCGSAQEYCISAPGTKIVSTDASSDGYMTMSGTSMATPVVSGSIALLNGYYPWLNAQNIAYLLLETANDEGVYSDSATYGRGALDLDAAVTTPLGDLSLPLRADLNSIQSASLSKLSTSGVLQNKLLKMMPKTITAYDILKRPFQYETSKLINTTHSSSANLKNAVSRVAMGKRNVKTIKDEKSGFSFSSSNAINSQGYSHLSSMEVVQNTDSGSNRFYYADNSKYMHNEDVLLNDNNPYLAMREAYGAENSFSLSENSKLKLSLQSGLNGLYERDEEVDGHSFDERSYSVGAEYSFKLKDYLEISTLGGMLFEEDALLGLNGVGGFGINDSSTYYMGLKAKLDLTKKFSILMAYYRGYTSGSDSSMLSISDLETESFMLAGEYMVNKNNKIGLMLSSPMSIVKGSASMMYSTGRDNNSNSAYLEELRSSLRPEAKEYDLGIYYQGDIRDNLSINGKVETRFNADGEKGVNDYIGVVGAEYSF